MAKSKNLLIALLGFIWFPSFSQQNLKRREVQAIYTRQIGVREATGNNDGKSVAVYLKAVNLPVGSPWCAAMVCFVLSKANVPNPRSGWSPALFPSGNVIYQPSKRLTGSPQTGDVFGIWFANRSRIAHVGFVDHWGSTYVVTVEGNTNEAGSREGDGVYRKKRLTRQIYAVSSFIK